MTKEIIEKYRISFQNRIDEEGRIEKIPDMSLDCVATLLYEWNANEIDDDDHGLLIDIDAALGDTDSEIEAGSSYVDILIYHDITKFYPGNGGEIYSMPTTDFKQIVIGWRDFLLSPPINGEKAR